MNHKRQPKVPHSKSGTVEYSWRWRVCRDVGGEKCCRRENNRMSCSVTSRARGIVWWRGESLGDNGRWILIWTFLTVSVLLRNVGSLILRIETNLKKKKSINISIWCVVFPWFLMRVFRHFCKTAKSDCHSHYASLSARPRATTRLLLDWFSWNLILAYFSKICRETFKSH
jgi:hypothetical protein